MKLSTKIKFQKAFKDFQKAFDTVNYEILLKKTVAPWN